MRGCLALVVVAQHMLEPFGVNLLCKPAHVAVLIFFVMSGYVLALSYDGRPAVYMLRRVVRLWPLYALCVIVGSARLGIPPGIHDLTWTAVPTYPSLVPADPPAWSVVYEAWAIPVSPLLFWMVKKAPMALVALVVLTCPMAVLLDAPLLDCAPAFLIGMLLSGCGKLRPVRVPQPLLWLGKVSFSLYLTHGLIMLEADRVIGPWGGVYASVLVLPVAWLAWRFVERPSIEASRMIGRRVGLSGVAWTPAPALGAPHVSTSNRDDAGGPLILGVMPMTKEA